MKFDHFSWGGTEESWKIFKLFDDLVNSLPFRKVSLDSRVQWKLGWTSQDEVKRPFKEGFVQMRDPVKTEGMGSSSWLSPSLERMTLWNWKTDKMEVGINWEWLVLLDASQVVLMVKNPPDNAEMWVHALGGKDPLEEDMAAHSDFLAWRSPMDSGFPSGLRSIRSQRDTTQAIWHALGVWVSLEAQTVMQETQVWSRGREDPLEKATATQSSILAWKTPWTEEPGGLQSMESQRVRHDWATNSASAIHIRNKRTRLGRDPLTHTYRELNNTAKGGQDYTQQHHQAFTTHRSKCHQYRGHCLISFSRLLFA